MVIRLVEVEVEVQTYDVENPKYGKQLNMEEHRNTCLREVLGKAIGGFALGMALRTKEQLQDLYSQVEDPEEYNLLYPATKDEAFESATTTLELTKQDVIDYENRNSTVVEGQTYSEAKD